MEPCYTTASRLLCLLLIGLFFQACQETEPEAPVSNGVLSGTIVGRISGAPIANATVSLCYHATEMTRDGLLIGGTECENPELLTQTMPDGSFHLPILADTSGLPTYAWVRIIHPDYETMNELYVHLEPGTVEFGVMGLRSRSDGQSPPAITKVSNRRKALSPRKGKVFVHSQAALKKLFSEEELSMMAPVSERIPQGQYVRYQNPVRGYNKRPKGFRKKNWDAWSTIILPLDIAMAAVAEGEIGTFTHHTEAIKTQAIWARTYALHKGLNEQLPQNHQLAFSTTIAENFLCASKETEGTILSHNFAPGGMGFPLLAVFSARCNGDFTQPGQLAKWSGCDLSGSWNPYLIAVECSKHSNCDDAGQRKACCNIDSYWGRYLFGHGAGGCQHGMKDFAEGNYAGGASGLSHTVIAPYYFYGSQLVSFYGDVWNMPKPNPRGAD